VGDLRYGHVGEGVNLSERTEEGMTPQDDLADFDIIREPAPTEGPA
jgi:hypothetical protein